MWWLFLFLGYKGYLVAHLDKSLLGSNSKFYDFGVSGTLVWHQQLLPVKVADASLNITFYQLEQVVLFYLKYGEFLKTSEPLKMLSEEENQVSQEPQEGEVQR